MTTSTIALPDAAAEPSTLMPSVHDEGASHTIAASDTPAAVPNPLPSSTKRLKAFGILAGKHPKATREQERAAFAAALESTHV